MSSKFLGVVIIFVIGCNVCPIHSEYSVGNFHQDYDMAKLIQHASTRLDIAKNLNKLVDDYGISLHDEFKSFTAENLYSAFIDFMSNNGSGRCIKDLSYVFGNLRSQWAQQMLDSFGKPERGIMKGNFHWMGEFDECISASAPSKANNTVGGFNGQYCNLQVTTTLYGQPVPITIGVCLPDSCDPIGDPLNTTIINYVLNITNKILMPNTNITEIKLTCKPGIKKLTTAAICVIFLLSIFIMLALIGSCITASEKFAKIDASRQVVPASDFEELKTQSVSTDIDKPSLNGNDDVPYLGYAGKYRPPNWIKKLNPFFNCFCIFTNGAKLFDTSHSEGQLPCLHGIRFLSLTWVMVCHTYAHLIGNARESLNILPMVDHWLFQLIMNGFYSVDSFYLLSGFLLTYLFFEVASKNNGKVPWVYFYVHRYVRLTPVYMIVLAFHATIYPYLSNGPLWTTNAIDPICEKNWWMNVLYINSFTNKNEKCLEWSWYLSNDMQYFVISPIFLIALWRFPAVGLAILACFMTATTVANFVISYQNELVAGLANIFEVAQPQNFLKGVWNDYTNMIYVRPYTRISPYLVGIALAYYLYQRRKSNCGKNSLVVLSCGWLIASTVTLACLFGLYHRKMSLLEMSFYTAFNRTCFALGLAWVLYVCITGQGGFVNNILSFKLFIPLSRLSYCAYLVHPILMNVYFNSRRSLLDFSHFTMIILYLGFLVISYSIALITSLLFESPVVRLDKLVRSKLGDK